MKKIFILLFLVFTLAASLQAQVKIGDNPNTIDGSAMLELESTNKGFLLPRMTETEIANITSPADGLQVYNTTSGCLQFYSVAQGNAWRSMCGTAINAGTATLTCGSISTSGTPIVGKSTSGVTITIPYTGGNGGTYTVSSTSTGVTGLTASGSGSFANGAGSIVLNVTGTPNATGTATFSITAGGSTCASVNITVKDAFAAILTDAADLAAYNAALNNTYVEIAGSGNSAVAQTQFTALKNILENSAYAGLTVSDFYAYQAGAGANSFGGRTNMGFPAQDINIGGGTPIPCSWADLNGAANYIVGFAIVNTGTQTTQLKTSTTDNNANNYGPVSPSAACCTRYFILKGGTTTTTDTKLGFYSSSNVYLVPNSHSTVTTTSRTAVGNVTGTLSGTNSALSYPLIQVIATPTKQW